MNLDARKLLLSARLLAGGIKSYLPIDKDYTGTGGSNSARYCYAAWLGHLVAVAKAAPKLQPRVVAELGPGDSLGLGLAALLSGVKRYVALDVLAHTNVEVNLEILDQLVTLFRSLADVPGKDEFPELYPRLNQREFPGAVLASLGLAANTDPRRVDALRQAIRQATNATPETAEISYLCPWPTASVTPGSIDLIVSQAVLQDMLHWTEPDNLEIAFDAMARWLKPGGIMSHQVNLAFPDTEAWNQHWAYGELTWKVMRGRRPYYVNRVPASEYLRLCQKHGFEVASVTAVAAEGGVSQGQLSRRHRGLPPSDYSTRGLHFVAIRK